MFRKTVLTAATLAVALLAFQPAAQAHGIKVKFGHGWGHGHGWAHGHGGHGHGHWGHGPWGPGHGGFGCYWVKKKTWHKGHGHFHFKKVKVCY
jgi:hypothetical protein